MQMMELGEALLENVDDCTRDGSEAVELGEARGAARGLEQTIDKIGFGKSDLNR